MNEQEKAKLDRYFAYSGRLRLHYETLCMAAQVAWLDYEECQDTERKIKPLNRYIELDKERNLAYLRWFGPGPVTAV